MRGVVEEKRDPCVGELPGELDRGQADVEWDEHGAKPADRVHHHDEGRSIARQQRHPVAVRHTKRGELTSRFADPVIELSKRPIDGPRDERRMPGVRNGPAAEPIGQTSIRHSMILTAKQGRSHRRPPMAGVGIARSRGLASPGKRCVPPGPPPSCRRAASRRRRAPAGRRVHRCRH